MVSKQELLSYLPAFKNKSKVANWGQSIASIADTIVVWHGKYESDYDRIYPFFDTGDVYSTCQMLWDFCKYKLIYKVESKAEQTVKSPTAILQDGARVDCKHYSLFIGGVLDAIKHNDNDNFEWFYRFVSDKPDKIIGHVFVVVVYDGNEIWVDPCMNSFNEKSNWTNIEDYKPMPVYAISGVGAVGTDPKTITVDSRKAESSFLTMVSMNAFNLKDLLSENHELLYGKVRQWYTGKGFDFNNLIRMIQS